MNAYVVKIVGIVLCAIPTIAVVQPAGTPKPPPPSEVVPDLSQVKPTIFCGDCDQKFDPATHKEVLDGLVANPYMSQLRKALYMQDVIHQFSSKAHFDNCDFENSITYMGELLSEVDGHVVTANRAKENGDQALVESTVEKAFFALGQALHGIQDFYAHTNYVELTVGQVKKSTDIPIVSPWRDAGKAKIANFSGQGLVSGYVFWGLPQKCADGTPSHSELAKDKATTPSGKVKVPHLQNRNRYQIAAQLARADSQVLIDEAFRRWPLLKEVNGQYTAFEVLVDRRGL
jgi:Heterokaryon incompatibility protein Het-C